MDQKIPGFFFPQGRKVFWAFYGWGRTEYYMNSSCGGPVAFGHRFPLLYLKENSKTSKLGACEFGGRSSMKQQDNWYCKGLMMYQQTVAQWVLRC
jgi:hypothetical protein